MVRRSSADRSHKRHKKPVPAPVSEDEAKRIKEKFQREIAVDIVQLLSNYRRDSCTVGRITTDDDFKHLAKKVIILSVSLSVVFYNKYLLFHCFS